MMLKVALCFAFMWEVANCNLGSGNEKELAHGLWKYIACSLSRVKLVIGLKIECYPAVTGQPQDLKKVMCTFWEADYAEMFTTLEESGSELNHLMRCDIYSNDVDDYPVFQNSMGNT